MLLCSLRLQSASVAIPEFAEEEIIMYACNLSNEYRVEYNYLRSNKIPQNKTIISLGDAWYKYAHTTTYKRLVICLIRIIKGVKQNV